MLIQLIPEIPTLTGNGREYSNRSDSGHSFTAEINFVIILSIYGCISGPFQALELRRTTHDIPSGCRFIIPAVPEKVPVLIHVPLITVLFHPTGAKLLLISVMKLMLSLLRKSFLVLNPSTASKSRIRSGAVASHEPALPNASISLPPYRFGTSSPVP